MVTDSVVYEKVHKNDETPIPKPPKGFGARHVQAAVLFICLSIGFSLKAILSVSMVAMTGHGLDNDTCLVLNNTHSVDLNKTVLYDDAHRVENQTACEDLVTDKWNVYRKYKWNKSTQDMIISSFFLGYTAMQMPMGYLAQKFGGKRPIIVALAVNGVLSLATPWILIMGDWIALCVCRLIQGMTQAAFYPGIHTMLGKWAPLSERGRLSTYVYTGSPFGTVIIFQLSGLFAGNPSLGWPAIFWFFGLLGLAGCCLLAWLGASSPHDHPSISAEEMIYITQGANADMVPKNRKTPWKQILSCKAIWGLVVCHAGSASSYLLLLTQIPTYINYVLDVNIQKNGIFSSLPYISTYFAALLFGFLTDYASNRNILSLVNIRRVANTIGMAVASLFLVGFSFTSNTTLAVILLVLSNALHAAVHVGFHINQIDLAPNFAGTIMGLGNMIANLTSLLIPVIVSNIVRDDMANQQKWQIVFLIICGFQLITNAIYVIFAKATVQPWNFYGDENVNDNEKDNEQEKTASDEKKNIMVL